MVWKDRAQLAAERDQLRTALSAMHNAAAQMSSPGDGRKAAPDGSPPVAASSAVDDENLVSQTGSVSSPAAVRASIRTAQMALTQLGYGVVKADGAMGPKTQRAIAAFEQANGIAVTGGLGAETVHALKQAISKAGTDWPFSRQEES
jgi:peptidoglycan hydrolase-like protein with peptidoglycan-binding domain